MALSASKYADCGPQKIHCLTEVRPLILTAEYGIRIFDIFESSTASIVQWLRLLLCNVKAPSLNPRHVVFAN